MHADIIFSNLIVTTQEKRNFNYTKIFCFWLLEKKKPNKHASVSKWLINLIFAKKSLKKSLCFAKQKALKKAKKKY